MSDQPAIPAIDWSSFGPVVTTTCRCDCGREYRSHAKTVRLGDRWRAITQQPCPGCGRRDGCHRISGDPETWTIGGTGA